jgi:cation diffusion facilitator CzcD-associated flavoprotein CzcO
MENFTGKAARPQTWGGDLDDKDKQVVVIGSGAKAATLVTAIAAETAHIRVLKLRPFSLFPVVTRMRWLVSCVGST